MRRTTVKEIMTRTPITCNPDTPLDEIVKIQSLAEINAILVVDPQGKLVGLVSQMDLMRIYGEDLKHKTAQEIMTTKLIVISGEETVDRAAALMVKNRVHRLVVPKQEDPQRAEGVISASDIIHSMVDVELLFDIK